MRPIKSLAFFTALIWILAMFAVTSAQQTPSQFTGLIDDDTPFIEIAFAVEAATTITIDLDATSGDLDTYLYLVDGSGKILAENDDRVRGDTNSSIREFFIPTGDYTVIVSRYGVTRGDTIGEYQLNITYNAQTTEQLVYDVSQQALADMGFPELAPKPKAEWTILVYYGGDSTLETSLMSDFVEFERAGGSTENTRIVALLDRYGLSDANGAWTGARLFEVMQNTTGDFGQVPVPTMDSIPLADLGDTDTGNGETLARFLTWGMMNYPAEHYVVAFGGHGGGWRGVITDDTSETIITLPELDEALRVAKTATGIDQFDLVLNDACLMSSVEYYDVVSRHVEYALASPEIVIDPALDMTLLVELIRGDFDIDKLGEPLVNTYIERDIFVKQRPDSRYMTFASSQLDEMADLRRTIESFARVVNQNPLTYAPLLGQARSNAYTYAKFLGGDNDYDVDLGHFMRQIIAYSGDANIINPARDVLRALEDVRLYGNAADYARLYTSYYSIYFPAKSKDFNPSYFNDTPLKQWAEMLANYYNSTTPRLWSNEDSVLTYHPPIAPEVKITTAYPEVANAQNPPVLGLEVVGRGLSQGQFTVDQITENGDKIRLMSTPILTEVTVGGTETEYVNTWKSGLDLSYFNWQPFTLSVVTDGQVAHNELIIKSRDIGTLAGRFRIPNSDNWVEVAVIFNPLGYVEQVIGRADILGVVAPITIPRGAEFQAYRYVVMPDGDVKPEAGNTYTWGENGIAYVEQTVPAGDYELGFLVKSFNGTNGFASS
ncbi:MAG: DVUA0089 family protein, partial [Anaerolineae bacterium]|nr:DVUA0089 family protein [Anaerolineae bacterium]